MKSVRAGLLRHRVAIVSVTEGSPNADGSPTYTTSTVATVWGDWSEVGGGEPVVAQKTTATVTDIVRIRPYAGLTSRHRLQVAGKTLEIVAINDVEGRGRLKEITCISLV